MTITRRREASLAENGSTFGGGAGNCPASPFVIGVAGGSGSGKTTVVQRLSAELGANAVSVIDLDSYYKDQSHLSANERAAVNFDHPSALDFDLLLHDLLELRSGKSIGKPVYCFATHSRTHDVTVIQPAQYVIVEGIFGLYDSRLRSLMDLKLFIDADPDVRFIRRLQRDVADRGRTPESVITQYLETVRPMHMRYIKPTQEFADLVLDGCASLGTALPEIHAAIRSIANPAVNTNSSETYETAGAR
jgi:uridine kinase